LHRVAAHRDASQIICQTISHYRILSQLGGGEMGVVYEAEDLKLQRHVVLNSFEKLKRKVPRGRSESAMIRQTMSHQCAKS